MLWVLSVVPTAADRRLTVRVIDRIDNQTAYTYVVPGYQVSTTTAAVGCVSGLTTNCTADAATTTTTTPSFVGSYGVRGATLSLELPDGRIGVVNCDSKANFTDWSTMNPKRSCRVPPKGISLEAEFDGEKVKLRWRVGIDGEQGMAETYKLLAVLPKR